MIPPIALSSFSAGMTIVRQFMQMMVVPTLEYRGLESILQSSMPFLPLVPRSRSDRYALPGFAAVDPVGLLRSSTAVVLLLIQSAFWSNRVSAWMQVIIFATALLSYFRPHYGLSRLRLSRRWDRWAAARSTRRCAAPKRSSWHFSPEPLVRGWTLREFRTFPSTRLEIAALIFGFVVAASCVEQIWFLQIQMDFAWPFAQELLSYASRNYFTSSRGYGMLFRAMLLLEGMALVL